MLLDGAKLSGLRLGEYFSSIGSNVCEDMVSLHRPGGGKLMHAIFLAKRTFN